MSKCPLMGIECPHKKVIHVAEITNYQATEEKHLCSLCGPSYLAHEAGNAINGGPFLNTEAMQVFQMLNTIIKNPDIMGGTVVLEPQVTGCPKCGCTLEYILTVGKLGCSHCYEFYKEELLPLIKKCQSMAVKHTGKVPKQNVLYEIKKLEAQLNEAVDAENYAKAAHLRNEIRRLKGQ